jgi:hypothetical protein
LINIRFQIIPDSGKSPQSMGFNICLDQKTFIPGTPIGENIIQAIDSSRKVIFIITKNFLESDWGSYELEMTRMHAFRRGNANMVIVVIKGDVQMSSLPREICTNNFLLLEPDIQKHVYI